MWNSTKGRPESAVQARVTGRVQGVAFRYYAQNEAEKLGVTGWVRNADDGSVEVLAEGSTDALASYIKWLRRGPPSARVSGFESRPAEPTGEYQVFRVIY